MDLPLPPAPESACEMHITSEPPWCGGNPIGTWKYEGACHQPALQLLHDLCPAGSFKMLPAKVTGELTITSTSINGNFKYEVESRGVIELYEGCIAELGTCPRSLEGAPLQCEGDSRTSCICEITEPSGFGVDQGPVSITENMVTYDNFSPPLESRFCADDEQMFFEGLARENRPDFDFFYVLSRSP